MNPLAYIELAPQGEATASVIWLHGLEANGDDLQPLAAALKLPQSLPVRFIFPHAPKQAVTACNGLIMSSWYDILIREGNQRKVDAEQLQESVINIHHLIQQEIQRGIPANKIILAGFSQGGAVAYHAALTFSRPLAGLLAMSTYFPAAEEISEWNANTQMPIYIQHGTQDEVVVESLGQQALSIVTRMGYQAEYSQYAMAHQVCLEQVRDISAWLQKILTA